LCEIRIVGWRFIVRPEILHLVSAGAKMLRKIALKSEASVIGG
jgi:hypothetical protein